jgi:hypothetical protein
MAITKLDTVNQVLNELGFPPVAILNQTNQSLLISNKLDILLPEMLEETDWNFAIKFVFNNTPLTTTISPDFLYNYELPGDYNRLDRFSWRSGNGWLNYSWRIIDNVIMTNVRPILYYYVVNDADYSVFDSVFWRALVLYAAAECAVILTQNEKLQRQLEAKYQQKLSQAVLRNDMEREVCSTPYNDFDRTAYF